MLHIYIVKDSTANEPLFWRYHSFALKTHDANYDVLLCSHVFHTGNHILWKGTPITVIPHLRHQELLKGTLEQLEPHQVKMQRIS